MPPGRPILQYVDRPGLLDLGWGHPHPSLLPTDAWAAATASALGTYGWQALTYGYEPGPGPLREWIAGHLGATDRGGEPDEIFVTAGASHALTLVCAELTRPGDVVLVDSPTYHLAFGILRDQGVELVAAPVDDGGIDPRAVAELITALRRRGRRVPLLYIVPTFGNPTGHNLPDDRRRELVAVGRHARLTIVEDDTYRDMVYEGAAPASLWRLGDGQDVVRIGSFAKTVAPGLRLGWIQASPDLIGRLARLGYVHSGGGVNHTTALAMAAFGASGAYREHLAIVRRAYATRRDALVAALRRLPVDLDVPSPGGGWFVWLPLPVGRPAVEVLASAEACGVSFMLGSTFHVDGADDDHIRLSFSLLAPAELDEAARRLGVALAETR
jgi:DNA-binding transcriptional MocR family regulator